MNKYDKIINDIVEKYVSKYLSESKFNRNPNSNNEDNKSDLDIHYERHVKPGTEDSERWRMPMMSKDDYDTLADALSKTPAAKLSDTRKNRYIGYTTIKGKYVKYDTLNNYLVVFAGDSDTGTTISCYKQPRYKFDNKVENHKDFKYADDLPSSESIPYKNVWKVKYTAYDDKDNAKYTSKEYFVNADYEDKAISKAIKEVTKELDNEAMDYTVTKDRTIEVHDFNGNVLEVRKNFEAEKVED